MKFAPPKGAQTASAIDERFANYRVIPVPRTTLKNSPFIEQARAHPKRIILPEADDPRILEAAIICMHEHIADISLIGDIALLSQALSDANTNPTAFTLIASDQFEEIDRCAQALFERRQHKGMTLEQAHERLRAPLAIAMACVAAGRVDGCVAGATHTTGDVIRAALEIIGTDPEVSRLSSAFLMMPDNDTQNTPLVFADCAINIDPDPETLVEIARQSAKTSRQLLNIEPRIAMLSFSTAGSAAHPAAQKVRDASALLQKRHPELPVLGEIQFDAALIPEVRAQKWPNAPYTDDANVFVFPNLDAGNIGYKIAERLGNYQAVGPALQGLAKPVNDLSRGASVQAIVETIAVTAVMAQ